MKRCFNTILAVALMCSAAAFVGCSDDYQGDIDSLGNRLTTLETQVSAIEKQIADGAVISSVTSTTTGINITLSNGESYDVNNGKDGSVVEVKSGNWYIDGVDTGLAAKGENGADGKDGVNGTDGTDGKDGVNGTDGTDGKDGADGTNGKDGVDGINGNYYLPNTATGTFIEYVWDAASSIYKQGKDTGISFIAPDSLTAVVNEDGTVTLNGLKDADGNAVKAVTLGVGEISSLLVSEAKGDGFVFNVTGGQPIAAPYYLASALPQQTLLSSNEVYKYIVNPSNATKPAKDWSMYAVAVETRATTPTLAMKGTEFSLALGYTTVKGKFDVVNLPVSAANTENRFYLQANLSDDSNVKSNTATLEPINLKSVFIGNTKSNTLYKSDAKIADDYPTVEPLNTVAVPATHQLKWADGASYDLASYVYASAYKDIAAATDRTWLENYRVTDYSFRFSMPETYLGTDGITNQQVYASITEAGVMTLNKEWGTSAKERTPLVKVELMSDTDFGTALVVATAYFKVQFVEEVITPTTKDNIVIDMDAVKIDYAKLYDQTAVSNPEMTMSWEVMNQKVYNNAAIQLSYAQFCDNFDTTTPTLTINDTVNSFGDMTIKSYAAGTTPTDLYFLNVLPTTKWDAFTWSVTYVSKDPNKYGNVVINHKFEVVEPAKNLPVFEPVYVVDAIQMTKGREVNSRHEMSVEPAEAFVNYLKDYNSEVTKTGGLDDIYNNTLKYTSEMTSTTLTGVALQGTGAVTVTNIIDQVVYLTEPLTVASKDVPMEFAVTYENGEKQAEPWTIRFMNPITISFAEMKIATDDIATTLDISKCITVKFNKSVVYENAVWDTTLQAKYGLSIKLMTANILPAANELTFDATTGVFTWNNKGTQPMADFKGADVNVIVSGSYDTASGLAGAGDYATATGSGDLIILKY